MKNRFALSVLLVIILFLLSGRKVDADYMYGNGEPSRQITVDKKVKPVSWQDWSDNLSSNEVVFTAQDLVDFKIIVKNSGENDLSNIEVIDYFPNYVNFIFGPGDYKEDGHKLEWNIDHLNPGEEKEFKLRVQVVKSGKLPNSNTFCIANKTTVKAETGEYDEDTAQFYIETRILAARLPDSGSDIVLGTIISLVLASIGILARKFGRGEILS